METCLRERIGKYEEAQLHFRLFGRGKTVQVRL